MNKQLEQKLVDNGWDIDEVRSTMGDTFMDYIYDCDEKYCYYHPAAFEKGRMDAEGNLEVWYNNHWTSDESELPEV